MISSSPCQILSSAFVRGCTLSFALRLVLEFALAVHIACFRLRNAFAFFLGFPRGCHIFGISFLEILAIALRDVFES